MNESFSLGPDRNTGQRLLESALALFSEKGYRGASIREIIERAGVTRPVLYYYFENKEDLFCRLVESCFDNMLSDLDLALAGSGLCRDRLKMVMRMMFHHAEQSLNAVRLVLQAIFADPCDEMRLDITRLVEGRIKRVAALFQEGLDSGEIAAGEAQTLAMAFTGIMDMYMMAKVHRPGAVLTPELADYLVDLFFQGAAHHNPAPVLNPFPLHKYSQRKGCSYMDKVAER